MKLANLNGRAVLVAADGRGLDVHEQSKGLFGPSLPSVYTKWREFYEWAALHDLSKGDLFIDPAQLGPPSPQPAQILAFGLNYSQHATESGFSVPTGLPPVFPKFLSSLSGPVTTVVLPDGGKTDWEAELVVIIGINTQGIAIDETNSWNIVAGVTAGQDISDRASQFSTPAPQFGLGKSFPGFAPTGPWLVTPDEIPDRNDIQLECTLDGVIMQADSTRNLLVPISRLIAELSGVITLTPGDLIFTGTPKGVGHGRTPPQYITDGQELVTRVRGVGELRQRFVNQTPNGHAPKSLKGIS